MAHPLMEDISDRNSDAMKAKMESEQEPQLLINNISSTMSLDDVPEELIIEVRIGKNIDMPLALSNELHFESSLVIAETDSEKCESDDHPVCIYPDEEANMVPEHDLSFEPNDCFSLSRYNKNELDICKSIPALMRSSGIVNQSLEKYNFEGQFPFVPPDIGQDKTIIALDTNILEEWPEFIAAMMSEENHDKIVYIPRQVSRELFRHATSKTEKIRTKGQRGIEFLNDICGSETMIIFFQTTNQEVEANAWYDALPLSHNNADIPIANACHQVQIFCPTCKVMLMTEDKRFRRVVRQHQPYQFLIVSNQVLLDYGCIDYDKFRERERREGFHQQWSLKGGPEISQPATHRGRGQGEG